MDEAKINSDSDLLDGVPVISPLAWSFSYHFPVHKISPAFQPQEASGTQTHLVIYRDYNCDVHFMEINAVTARLIQLISDNSNKTGRSLLQQIAAELNHPQYDIVIHGGVEILHDLKKRSVILGVCS